jgi:hypothetical protein
LNDINSGGNLKYDILDNDIGNIIDIGKIRKEITIIPKIHKNII